MSGGSSISPEDGHSNALLSDDDPRGRGDDDDDDGTAAATSTSNGSGATTARRSPHPPPPPMTSRANNNAFSPILQRGLASTVSQDPQQQQHQHPQQQISQDENDDDEEEEEEEDLWIVSCRCESAKAVSTLLSCLKHVNDNYTTTGGGGGGSGNHGDNFPGGKDGRKKSSTHAINPVSIFCSPTSITFHVYGKAKQTQASVDMQAASLFSEYRTIEPPPRDEAGQEDGPPEDWKAGGEFCVNLTTVLDCLHVLGTQSLERTKLCFAYNAAKEIFKLELLEESGVLSTAAIPGMLPPHDDVGNSLALAFRSSPLVARMICKSETLREVIPELELVAGATIGTVSLGLVDGLEIATVGHLGECLVSVPSRGSHIVSFDVPAQHQVQPAPARSYPLHSLLGSMRGLEIAEETCITINSIGMIAIQHQVLERNIGDGSPNFVDFIMCCLEDDDDEDDNDEDDEEDEEDRGGGDRAQDPTMSQEQSQRKASQQSLRLSRSQSSASTPGDAVPSMQPPKRRPVYNQENHNSDDDDEGDDDSHLPFSSAAPLFGSVVADASTGSSNAVLSPRVGDRSVRRRASQRTFSRRDRRQRLLDNNSSNNSNNQGGDDESEVSRNLLDDSEDDQHNDARRHNNNNDDDDDRYMEDELSQPLDVTDTAETCVDRDRGECSSPEIVYGRQH